MPGALQTLYGALQSSQFLQGVTLAFGEEFINAQDALLPYVLMVPRGGEISNQPGYQYQQDANVEMTWGIRETVDLYLWNSSPAPDANPIDHADSIETLRQQVLSALQDQRAQYTDTNNVSGGLAYRAISERWETMGNAVTRFGRSLIVTVLIEISVPMTAPQEATVTSVTYTTTI